MQWNTDAQQDKHAQNQQDSYHGYLGWSPEAPQTAERHQEEQQHTAQQQEYQSPGSFEQISYIQQEQVQPALALNYTGLAAVLCYSIGWLTGLLFLLFARENRFVRFHALQSLAFFGWCVAIVQASRGKYYRLPFIGDLVAASINCAPTVK